jgi:hypothetical protein
LRDLQPWKHVSDPLATARQLCVDLASKRIAVLEAARASLRKAARYRLPPPADILAAVDAAETAYDERLEASRATAAAVERRWADDPELARRSEALRAALLARVGEAVFREWFAGVAAEAVEGGRLVVSAPTRFVRAWIEKNYQQALTDAAAAAFGTPVARVDVVAPPQAEHGRAA